MSRRTSATLMAATALTIDGYANATHQADRHGWDTTALVLLCVWAWTILKDRSR